MYAPYVPANSKMMPNSNMIIVFSPVSRKQFIKPNVVKH